MTKYNYRKIYDKTSGKCHFCGKKLSFKNYGKLGTKAPWNIDHSVAQANEGSDHINNLYPSCPSCNSSKGKRNNRSVRNRNGLRRAPLSAKSQQTIRKKNTMKGAITGAAIGLRFGPVGAIIGAGIGAVIGNEIDANDY